MCISKNNEKTLIIQRVSAQKLIFAVRSEIFADIWICTPAVLKTKNQKKTGKNLRVKNGAKGKIRRKEPEDKGKKRGGKRKEKKGIVVKKRENILV